MDINGKFQGRGGDIVKVVWNYKGSLPKFEKQNVDFKTGQYKKV